MNFVPLCEHLQTMLLKRLTAVGLACLTIAFCALIVTSPHPLLAETVTSTISQGLDNTAGGTYDTNLTATVFIGNLIRTLIAATGILFLVITVYAGILYMTAMGDDSKIKKAKGMLTSSVIGIVIVVGAYALTSYVVTALSQATAPTATDSTTGGSSAEGG